jgi:hypothetical protein
LCPSLALKLKKTFETSFATPFFERASEQCPAASAAAKGQIEKKLMQMECNRAIGENEG